MKRGMSKLLSALLIATLVFTSAGMAFADTAESDAQKGMKAAANEQKTDYLKNVNLDKQLKKQADTTKAATTKAQGKITVKTLVKGNEKIPASVIQFNAADKLANYKYGFRQAVKLPAKGTILIAAYNNPRSSGSVSFGLYKDAALTQQVASSNYNGFAAKGQTGTLTLKVPAAGTYYIGAYTNDYYTPPQANVAISMSAAFISGADRSIKSGATIAVGQKDKQVNYFKFKATKTGYLKVQSTDYGKVSLYNSKKKALSNKTSTSYAPTYGVKKGSTYYIRVEAGYNSDGGYQLKVTNTKITEKSGKKKSKAVTLKKKKTKKGTITAGSSQADWYKFKLTGKKKVKITLKGATNNKLKVTLYRGGKKIGTHTMNYTNKGLTLSSTGKLPKGNYYIKIYRGSKTSSGWYSVSWK